MTWRLATSEDWPAVLGHRPPEPQDLDPPVERPLPCPDAEDDGDHPNYQDREATMRD